MRYMSFTLTPDRVLDRTKTVTRRTGWTTLSPGQLIQPALKCMGLKRGEKVQRLGAPILTVSVRRERLRRMTDDVSYGLAECALEGFGSHPTLCRPSEFIVFFCKTHRCAPDDFVTRIEFEYT